MSLEGQQLGEFTILERIGQGGMGAVYKASQTSLDRLVALKTLQASLAEDAEYIGRFRQEAKAAAKLAHPNLVQVYSAGETGGLHWFAMEYVEGESAQARLKRKGRLDPLEAIAIVIHVATALEYGWRKAALIHRDIKPDNIFLSEDGEVKLGDLGLAKSAGQTQGLTVTGASMGTPNYISPEQAQALKNVDLRADIYSLGCTLYHMLCGQPPYTGDSPVAIMMKHVSSPVPDLRGVWRECPPELAVVVMKMMQKPPEARPQSYEEVLAELRRVYDLLSGARAADTMVATPQSVAGLPQVGTSLRNVRGEKGRPGGASLPASLPAPRKSKAPLYVGIGISVVALAVGAYFLVPKLQLGNAPGLGSSASRPPEAGASPTSAFPSQSLGARGDTAGGTRSSVSQTSSATPPPAGSDGRAGARPSEATKDAPFVNSLGMKFVPVPILGGPTGGQRVLFSVWDTRVQDYAEFVKETKREWPKADFEQEPTHPAVNVSWEDAQLFCQWLTGREQAEGRLPAGYSYRLPSDHEWSCAVGLAGEDAAKLPSEKSQKINDTFPWGTEWPPPKGAGNYAGEELQPALAAGKFSSVKGVIAGYNDGFVNTSPVGSFAANRFGLFDMGGNVRQWCEDWFDKEQKDRVLRGAAWNFYDRYGLLSSYRYRNVPGYRNYDVGFRCVLAPASAPAPAVASAETDLPPKPPAIAGAPSDSPLAKATKDAPFVNTLGMKFVPVPIPGGVGRASSPAMAGEDTGPTTRVLFSVWDVRVQDYAAYAGAKKVDDTWTKANKYGVPVGRELNHPVVRVSWEDAQAFCQWLTEKESAEGKLPKGLKYRLPTDEEWSWAVGMPPELGGTPAEKSGKNSVDFPWGRDYPPTKVGNYADESFHAKFSKPDPKDPKITNGWIEGYNDGYATTSPVGSFPANAYGLYDMGGNVWQWCEDWFDASHKDRVLRGASWFGNDRLHLLSSYRIPNLPGSRVDVNGFRCVLGVSAR